MKKGKLILLINTYEDFPEKALSFLDKGKVDTWEECETLISSTEVRMKNTTGKEKEYYNNIYDIKKKYKRLTYIDIVDKINNQIWVNVFLDIKELNILYMIYFLNKNLHPGLYIPGGSSIEPWKPEHWD